MWGRGSDDLFILRNVPTTYHCLFFALQDSFIIDRMAKAMQKTERMANAQSKTFNSRVISKGYPSWDLLPETSRRTSSKTTAPPPPPPSAAALSVPLPHTGPVQSHSESAAFLFCSLSLSLSVSHWLHSESVSLSERPLYARRRGRRR